MKSMTLYEQIRLRNDRPTEQADILTDRTTRETAGNLRETAYFISG